MNVLIVGFTDYDELDRVMNKLIEDSQCYLFNVLVGGVNMSSTVVSLAEQWAINNGAPRIHIYKESVPALMKELEWRTDYLVMKREGVSSPWKQFMMRLKEKGKHGTCV